MQEIGKKIIDISELVDVFEAQEGIIEQIIGKTGNGKTYEATRRALIDLKQGKIVYTTWQLILPEYYDERENKLGLFFSLFTFRKNFYRFDFKKNWKFLDIDRPDLIEFVANLTDCVVYLDEGQDIFDSYEGRAMSQVKRKSLTRTRHLRKTLVIISQRAQAVAVTARANVSYFYKCVKSWAWFWPFATLFKVYRTEDMDEQNFPIWEKPLEKWKAELWHTSFASKEVYDSYNSWYLREGITKSQDVYFDAYKLNFTDKIIALFKKNKKAPLAYSYEELVKMTKEKQLQHKVENEVLTRKPKTLTKKIKAVDLSYGT